MQTELKELEEKLVIGGQRMEEKEKILGKKFKDMHVHNIGCWPFFDTVPLLALCQDLLILRERKGEIERQTEPASMCIYEPMDVKKRRV